ncbi:unnamed protein product [Meloidogyne enterolobii]|uniref:Uncharacterized protein n=1 Tax=Meloidogyne enterolobii TaxID=390850 RepID=A0ACB1A319_MELEN
MFSPQLFFLRYSTSRFSLTLHQLRLSQRCTKTKINLILFLKRNTLNGNEMIQDVLNQIKRTTNLNTNLFQQNLFITNYLNRLFNVQSSLKNFESNLENTRSAVLNSTRRLKLDEVNELTTALGEIGRESVELKGA